MPQAQFRKGDRVRFKLRVPSVKGTLKEDRGAIGIKGRRLYLVEFRADPLSPSKVELPAEEMKAVRGKVATK
jgi:hypothetical protein